MFHFITLIFAWLIRLYPLEFQEEYGAELQSVFEASLKDAAQGGVWNLLAVCLRELRDFPINLLQTHLEKKHMLKILHSQPVRFAWKGAVGFSLSFVVVNMSYQLLQSLLFNFEDSHIPLVWDQHYQDWFLVANDFISWTIASLIGGILFAAIFGEKAKFWRFAILGTLGWLVPGLISSAVFRHYSQSSLFTNYSLLDLFGEILTGIFLGLLIGNLSKGRIKKVGLVIAGAILYPVLVKYSSFVIAPFLPLAFSQDELMVYRGIEYSIAGILFGILMGLILGWKNKGKPVTSLTMLSLLIILFLSGCISPTEVVIPSSASTFTPIPTMQGTPTATLDPTTVMAALSITQGPVWEFETGRDLYGWLLVRNALDIPVQTQFSMKLYLKSSGEKVAQCYFKLGYMNDDIIAPLSTARFQCECTAYQDVTGLTLDDFQTDFQVDFILPMGLMTAADGVTVEETDLDLQWDAYVGQVQYVPSATIITTFDQTVDVNFFVFDEQGVQISACLGSGELHAGERSSINCSFPLAFPANRPAPVPSSVTTFVGHLHPPITSP